jgi:hypothetical protein
MKEIWKSPLRTYGRQSLSAPRSFPGWDNSLVDTTKVMESNLTQHVQSNVDAELEQQRLELDSFRHKDLAGSATSSANHRQTHRGIVRLEPDDLVIHKSLNGLLRHQTSRDLSMNSTPALFPYCVFALIVAD